MIFYEGRPVDYSYRHLGKIPRGGRGEFKAFEALESVSYYYVDHNVGPTTMFEEPGKNDPSDILSMNWGYKEIHPTLRTVLFWMGDTMDLFLCDDDGQPSM